MSLDRQDGNAYDETKEGAMKGTMKFYQGAVGRWVN